MSRRSLWPTVKNDPRRVGTLYSIDDIRDDGAFKDMEMIQSLALRSGWRISYDGCQTFIYGTNYVMLKPSKLIVQPIYDEDEIEEIAGSLS